MASLGSSIDVRSIPPARSGGTSLGSPVASTSGLSSGVPSLINAKSQRDLEVMKACHDIDLAMAEGSLDAIRKCYSIPGEYALRAPLPEQHPYNSSSAQLSISVDALEADLRFSFHPIIEKCLGWWRIFSSSPQLAVRAFFFVQFNLEGRVDHFRRSMGTSSTYSMGLGFMSCGGLMVVSIVRVLVRQLFSLRISRATLGVVWLRGTYDPPASRSLVCALCEATAAGRLLFCKVVTSVSPLRIRRFRSSSSLATPAALDPPRSRERIAEPMIPKASPSPCALSLMHLCNPAARPLRSSWPPLLFDADSPLYRHYTINE
ncbi:hypothetical protein BHE74_00039864 [Ensete ventricosum]|nr:hypothetical protein BHE74_00039864 [Ensete ventricosum]